MSQADTLAKQPPQSAPRYVLHQKWCIVDSHTGHVVSQFGTDEASMLAAQRAADGLNGYPALSDRQSVWSNAVTEQPKRPLAQGLCHANYRAMAHVPRSFALTPAQVGKAYGFPADGGEGSTIGFVELGGGYRESDLELAMPGMSKRVISLPVDGVTNTPGDDADAEVNLDIQVALVLAPKARAVVAFAPNSGEGFAHAIDALVQYVSPDGRKVTVISISWGQAEHQWDIRDIDAMEQSFASARAAGIEVTVAAGDNGTSDNTGKSTVDYPASSPHVIACGGTRLMLNEDGTIKDEAVWNDGTDGGATGGGVSQIFRTPQYHDLSAARTGSYQVALDGRGVPDVAGNADPYTGYRIFLNGQEIAVGGTSAVAPLWAAAIAILRAKFKGSVAEMLYANAYSPSPDTRKSLLRDISHGNNSMYLMHGAEATPQMTGYASRVGWDAVTGLGTPTAELFAEL